MALDLHFLDKTISEFKSGLVEIKNDKDGNLSLSIGRKSFAANKIIENLKSVFEFLKWYFKGLED